MGKKLEVSFCASKYEIKMLNMLIKIKEDLKLCQRASQIRKREQTELEIRRSNSTCGKDTI